MRKRIEVYLPWLYRFSLLSLLFSLNLNTCLCGWPSDLKFFAHRLKWHIEGCIRLAGRLATHVLVLVLLQWSAMWIKSAVLYFLRQMRLSLK